MLALHGKLPRCYNSPIDGTSFLVSLSSNAAYYNTSRCVRDRRNGRGNRRAPRFMRHSPNAAAWGQSLTCSRAPTALFVSGRTSGTDTSHPSPPPPTCVATAPPPSFPPPPPCANRTSRATFVFFAVAISLPPVGISNVPRDVCTTLAPPSFHLNIFPH